MSWWWLRYLHELQNIITAKHLHLRKQPEAWYFFKPSLRNCKSCVYDCDDRLSFNSAPPPAAVPINDFHTFIISSSSFSCVYNELTQWYLGISEITCSNPIKAWLFFGFSFGSRKLCVYRCDGLLLFKQDVSGKQPSQQNNNWTTQKEKQL